MGSLKLLEIKLGQRRIKELKKFIEIKLGYERACNIFSPNIRPLYPLLRRIEKDFFKAGFKTSFEGI